jgi:hypothetical protein
MFERYDEPARRTLFFARWEATNLGSRSIEDHIITRADELSRLLSHDPDLAMHVWLLISDLDALKSLLDEQQ